jgi:hypothetical protein
MMAEVILMSNKIKATIWGRELELGLTYDCYSDEEVLDSQKEAVKKFIGAESVINKSLEDVKKYCISVNGDEIGASTIENIFQYVMPKYLYVLREKDKRTVAIMCNYKFDQEHGIAVVFENEKFVKIGKQDIIL